jgi:hypothetical protein
MVMVSGGIPDDIDERETLNFLKRKARKDSLKQLGRLAERQDVTDFDAQAEPSGIDKLKAQRKAQESKRKGIILPGLLTDEL